MRLGTKRQSVYQYVVDGSAKALESGLTTPEMISETRFYDFNELIAFNGELRVVTYVVQMDGFDVNASASDIWSTTVQAVGK